MRFFLTFKLKQFIHVLLFLCTLTLLISLSKENFSSVESSVKLFVLSIFPSLFTFILFTEFSLRTNIIDTLAYFLGKPVSYIFKVNKNSTSAIIIGFLCGFPMGAKTVSKLYEDSYISKEDGSKLLMLVNNNNPVFILSTIGISIFNNFSIGILLLISHIISSIFTYFILSKFKLHLIIHKKHTNSNSFYKNSEKMPLISHNNKEIEDFFKTLKNSILNSFVTIGTIFGFIIIFNLIFNNINIILTKLNVNNNIISIISSLFEVTMGCSNISKSTMDITSKLCISSFALGFSGLCIIFQIYSTIYYNKFSFKNLIISKLTHGIFSCFITYILIRFTNILNLNSTIVFNSNDNYYTNNMFFDNLKISYIYSTLLLIILISIMYVLNIIKNKLKKKAV